MNASEFLQEFNKRRNKKDQEPGGVKVPIYGYAKVKAKDGIGQLESRKIHHLSIVKIVSVDGSYVAITDDLSSPKSKHRISLTQANNCPLFDFSFDCTYSTKAYKIGVSVSDSDMAYSHISNSDKSLQFIESVFNKLDFSKDSLELLVEQVDVSADKIDTVI